MKFIRTVHGFIPVNRITRIDLSNGQAVVEWFDDKKHQLTEADIKYLRDGVGHVYLRIPTVEAKFDDLVLHEEDAG